MPRNKEDIIRELLGNIDKLLSKKPFLRGGDVAMHESGDGDVVLVNSMHRATLPHSYFKVVTQERFRKELDPMCHDVLFDSTLPSICVKLHDGSYQEIQHRRVALAFQESIRRKKTLSICGNPRELTFHDEDPSEHDNRCFASLKWAWRNSNQDGASTKAVYTQQGYGDAGLLVYLDDTGFPRNRILSYEDGYVIISHNDDNGERIMECVYYADEQGVEHADCYTDRFLYRLSSDGGEDGGWGLTERVEHGFEEIPLVTKHGDVAWNDVQSLIDVLEILWNIFLVVQKRHGWGLLYIRGRIKDEARQIAGSIILNDTNVDGNGTVEFKTPPSPQNMIDTLDEILNQIQRCAGVTFTLPKDVKTSGDISGLAMQMTRVLDIEWATSEAIEWQNFASKHLRLFTYGFARYQVLTGENPTAITDYAKMKISCKFKMWQPFDEGTYNQMVCTAKQAGIISRQTAVEKNTLAAPDEMMRVLREVEKEGNLPSAETSSGEAGGNPAAAVVENQ